MLDLGDAAAPVVAWDRTAATPQATAAVEKLTEAMVASMDRRRAFRRADLGRLTDALGSLSLELYATYRNNPKARLRISRRKANYEARHRTRYNASPITHTNACRVSDWLVAQGLAGSRLGYYERIPEFGPNAASGQQSRIWATESLSRFFETDCGLTPQDVGFAPWLETVVLRDKGDDRIKRDIDYTDTEETRRMRRNLKTINEALAGYELSQLGENGEVSDLPPFRLRRVFSQSSFELGGRFYGGPWINMKPEARARLLIDGEGTVERDYSSLHPRLIYALEGIPLVDGEDPYEVPGWDGSERRRYAKIAFQQLINSPTGKRIRKPSDIPMEEVGKGQWPKLIRAFEGKHARVSHWFRSGRGLELQRIDSDMAERVILEMLRKGVCCLPVHDSFIVPLSARAALSDVMGEAYKAASRA